MMTFFAEMRAEFERARLSDAGWHCTDEACAGVPIVAMHVSEPRPTLDDPGCTAGARGASAKSLAEQAVVTARPTAIDQVRTRGACITILRIFSF
jgi:hypothetical protein